MAVNYATLFTKIGKIIAKSNSLESLAATTLPADLAAIVSTYGTAATTNATAQKDIEGINSSYAGFQSSVAGWRQTLKPFVDNTLTDQDLIVTQLIGLTQFDTTSILKALIQDMIDNAQTVKGNTVTLGAITADGLNVGNGTALVDKTLDGYSVPVRSGFAHIRYNSLASQLSVPSETMQLVCTNDSFSGGSNEGSEQWSWVGGQQRAQFDSNPEGSGSGSSVTTAHNDTTIQNLGFETFSANAPSNWTIDAGAAGTSIFQETTAGKFYRGTSALRFTGTAAAVRPAISQSISASSIRPRRRYLFTVRMFKDGAAPGAGNITIKFTGTGYTAAASEQINVTLASLTGSYVLHSFYWNVPATIPSDLKITIAVTGADLANTANIYFDSGSYAPVIYSGGVNVGIVSGSAAWTIGDKLRFTVANTETGLFQDFMRRAYFLQLPSKTDGSETINDALAG